MAVQNAFARFILVGMPGSGKSAVANILSGRLDCSMYDTDVAVEKRSGKTIADLWESLGEKTFRLMEHQVIQHFFMDAPSCFVMATGGGSPMFYDNFEMFKQNGTIIWLKSDLSIIANRLLLHANSRPISKSGNRDMLMNKLLKLYEERKDTYAKAHWHIENNGSAEETAEEIYRRWIKSTQHP